MAHTINAEADFKKNQLDILVDGEIIKTLDFSTEQGDPDIYKGSFKFTPTGEKKNVTYDVLFERSNETNPKIYIYPIIGDSFISKKVVDVQVKK